MPELLVGKASVPDATVFEELSVFKDKDGDLYLRTDTGAVYFGGGKDKFTFAQHYLEESDAFTDYAPYTDFGRLKLKL